MAKISAHGEIIGTVYYTTKAKRYMSDGVILKNIGFGWKLAGKIKPEFTPQQAFDRAIAKQQQFNAERPALAAYRAMLHDMAGLSLRWKLHAAVELLGDDVDGVWSEACDGYADNCSCSVDEVADLCRAYKVAVMESNELRQEKAQVAAE